ncbi:C2H2 type zinc finger domain protein [Fusarium austroafricanum]|uniref:C2H2 type zinc finger domain protein n=1 Tax=Fusarium austroafricanum TaxID=2364996 RepID=A0A8H4KCX0_9HYPO|nr:C2H2 type zinc finger domain protein [Fusarium austroafricanum]
MDDISAPEVASSFSKLYAECMKYFQRFLLALGDENCRVIRLEQVRLTEILDEYGRAKIWGDQSKADLPERARGSLDDTLRKDEELKSLVRAILMRLGGLLNQGMKYDPEAESDCDSISSVSADSDSSSDDEGERARHTMPKICLLVIQIREQMRSLYDLSSLLRRPKIADKYIRSVSSKNSVLTRNSDTIPLVASFMRSDESHVVEKFLQWCGLTKSSQKLEFDAEVIAPTAHDLTPSGVDDILWFCQRIARANTRRREQLQYWSDHPYDAKKDIPGTTQDRSPEEIPFPVRKANDKDMSGSQASTLKPADLKSPQAMPKSTTSKQSFSTAAISDIHETQTNIRPRTVYAPTDIGQTRSTSVPDPPKVEAGKLTFTCPYCGVTLDCNEMQSRQSWKRHVFRDLRPYVCTFQDCQNAEKLYVSRRDWIYHELQIHRRQYRCRECSAIFSSRKQMSDHLKEHYDDRMLALQLDVILDLCSQQADDLNSGKEPCLICGEELSLSLLHRHVAAHMEELALFVLPNIDGGEENGDSNASVRVAKLESNGNQTDVKSEATSLGFSDVQDLGHDPADFSKLLATEEDDSSTKVTQWATSREDEKELTAEDAVDYLQDPWWDSRATVVESLVKKELSEEVIGAVSEMLDHEDSGIRCSAVQVLSSQTTIPEEVSNAMMKLLEDKDQNNMTALSCAAKCGYDTSAKWLINAGANIETKDRANKTPLLYAARGGHEAVVRLLIEAGADVNYKGNNDETALFYAARNGHAATVELLLHAGADPNAKSLDNDTPLMWAASSGHLAVVELLVIAGADVNFQEKDIGAALTWAALEGHTPVVKFLRAAGAEPINEASYPGKAFLKAATTGQLAIVESLLEAGADIETVGDYGNTALIAAVCNNGHERVVKFLLEAGADPDAKGDSGRTPLSWAIPSGDEAIVKLLLDSNANILATDDIDGRTPIEIATEKGHESIAKLLQSSSQLRKLREKGSRDLNWDVYFDPDSGRVSNVDLIDTFDHESVVCCVRFSHSGRHLATGSDRCAKIFDVQTGDLVCELGNDQIPGEQSLIRSVCFSPDDSYLVAGSEDTTIRVWDILTRSVRRRLLGHGQCVYSVDVSPHRYIIASGSGDHTVRLWGLVEGQHIRTMYAGEGVSMVVISRNGRLVAASDMGKGVSIWNLETGDLLKSLRPQEGIIHSLAFSPDNMSLLSGSLDGSVKIWKLGKVSEGEVSVRTFEEHRDFVFSAAFTPDGDWVISGSKDRSVQLWDPKTGMVQFVLQAHSEEITSVAMSSQTGYFATASRDMLARVWSYRKASPE